MINSTKHIEILSKLEKLINKEIIVKSLVGFVKSMLSLVLVLFSFSLIEVLFRFSTEIRTFLFILISLCAISFLTYFILLPAVKVLSKRKEERYRYASYKVAMAYPSVKDELTNVLQLVNVTNDKIYSESLINAAFENLYTKVGPIDFPEIISLSSFSKIFKITSAVVISVFLSFLLSDSLSSALGRIYNYNTEYLPPQKFSFVVFPGDAQITKGENLLISIKAEGDKPKKISFNTKDETESSFRSETIFSDSLNQWSIQLNNIKNSFVYYVSAEGIESKQYFVRVIDRPIIKNLSLKIFPPTYTNLYKSLCKRHGISQSMCMYSYENPYAEKTNDLVNNGYLNVWKPRTLRELKNKQRLAVHDHNRNSRKKVLGKRTPLEFKEYID
ncbi:MAG TPA: hypothetical protein PK559_13755, partial [Ignavibacteriaceae bacterium]|nr:hypothetical protein [Ignavibacteriaceae bacterium]